MNTAKLTSQIQDQLSSISSPLSEIEIIRNLDSKTLDCKGLRFGKYEERFTVILDRSGNVKKGCIRFYEHGYIG